MKTAAKFSLVLLARSGLTAGYRFPLASAQVWARFIPPSN